MESQNEQRSQNEKPHPNDVYRRVAGLTCVSIFASCSLVESVVDDFVQRLAEFYEEADLEYKRQRELVAEAYANRDVERMLELVQQKSERYQEAVQKLLKDGRTAAVRSYGQTRRVIDLNVLAEELRELDEVFIPPSTLRQKRRSTLMGSTAVMASESSDATPYNECLKRLTELKMTPRLASAANRFQGEMIRQSVRSSKPPGSIILSIPQDIDEDSMIDEFPSSHGAYAPGPVSASQPTTIQIKRNSLQPGSTSANRGVIVSEKTPCTGLPRFNCETIVEENNSLDPGSNILMSMLKSPLLKLQEKLGFASSIRRPCPTPKTPNRTVKMFHRKLKPLPRKPMNPCLRPDDDELVAYTEMHVNQLASWASMANFHSTVEAQRDWNPYSLFGVGVRVIAYEEVFKTPDFRAMARTAVSELRLGHRPGRESRIERWNLDTNGYNTSEGMTSRQLEYVVKALKKKVDISHMAYDDQWVPCDESCTHDESQPWVRTEVTS